MVRAALTVDDVPELGGNLPGIEGGTSYGTPLKLVRELSSSSPFRRNV